MTADEMLYRCKVGYDNITNFSAPGYESIEWSLMLTEAQLELVKERITNSPNKNTAEETEFRAIDFSELIKSSVDNTGAFTTKVSLYQKGTISPNSIFFDLPDDVFYPIYEEAYTSEEDCEYTTDQSVKTVETDVATDYLAEAITAGDLPIGSEVDDLATLPEFIRWETIDEVLNIVYYGTSLETVYHKAKIKPISHSYYYANKDNPFKKPYSDLVWRLKYKSEDITSYPRRHELITDGSYDIDNYFLRYYRKPNPIIIYDAVYLTYPATRTIDGVVLSGLAASMNCELDEKIHAEIVNRAIVKAAAKIKDQLGYQISSMEEKKSE